MISEVIEYLSRKAWITTKISIVKAKGRNRVPVNWLIQIKKETEKSINLKLINVVQGYM